MAVRQALVAVACALLVPWALTNLVFAQAASDPKIEYYIAKRDWDGLVKIGRPAVPRLVAALSDADEDIRQGSIDALGRIGDRSATEPLVAVLNDGRGERAARTRQHAAKALVLLGYAPPNPDDKVAIWFWSRAPECLATYNYFEKWSLSDDAKSLDDLRKTLPDAVSPLCRLLQKLKANRDYQSAPYAAYALGQIGSTNAVDTLLAVADGQDYVPSIWANVAPDHPLTKAAVTALGKLRDPRAVGPLIKLLDPAKQWSPNGRSVGFYNVWEACARALAELGDGRAVAPLGKLLNSEDPHFFPHNDVDYRPAVMDALVGFGAASVDPLITATNNRNARTRELASEGLGKIGDKRAVQPLCKLLNDKESQVRGAAVNALGQLKDQRAIDPLVGALKDPDSSVREDAAKALDALGWKP